MASGPLIFITTMYLFKSARNQTVFLWVSSLSLLCLGLLGIYEFNNSEGISLFSRNPLPAGASLAILSAGPMILLVQKHSAVSRTILVFSLILAVTIIVLLAKKGPILNLIVILLFWAVFINLRYLKILLGLVLLIGCLLFFSESTLSKYKSVINLNTSITLRAELIFFGIHIFKQNPVWGIGSRTNLNSYTDNYK
ncbi:MAG: O-antigen ligase family protein, partial [Nitrospinia bacterium]